MTSFSKNMSIDKLDDIVNKYNNRAIKMNLLVQSQVNILILIKKVIRKLLDLKLVII